MNREPLGNALLPLARAVVSPRPLRLQLSVPAAPKDCIVQL